MWKGFVDRSTFRPFGKLDDPQGSALCPAGRYDGRGLSLEWRGDRGLALSWILKVGDHGLMPAARHLSLFCPRTPHMLQSSMRQSKPSPAQVRCFTALSS